MTFSLVLDADGTVTVRYGMIGLSTTVLKTLPAATSGEPGRPGERP